MKKILLLFFALLYLFGCKKDKNSGNSGDGSHVTTTFTIPADSIKLNPTGNAPLSALINFKTTLSGHTEILVEGKNGSASDIRQAFTDNGTLHSIPVLGLYANYKNTVKVYVINSSQDTTETTINITTGGLPVNYLPTYIHVDVSDVTNMESGLNLVSNLSAYPTTPNVPFMMDSFGDIRWILDFTNDPVLKGLSYENGINRLQDGNYRVGDVTTEKIYEIDPLGKIIKSWGLGGYIFHHDIVEKPNGNFLVSVSSPTSTHLNGEPTDDDYVIEIDRTTGAIVTTWDLKVSLDENRRTLIADAYDWIHVNGLAWDPSDNTLIVSGRVQGVFKLTSDNQVKWIMGPHRGWGTNRSGQDLNKFLLTPLDSKGVAITDTSVVNGWTNAPDFEWSWYQHSTQVKTGGDLLIFDNGGATRNYNANSPKYSRGVEYKIDPVKMTIQQVWSYGEDRGADFYSMIISSIYYYPTSNHMLISPGYEVPNTTGLGGKIVEVDYATQKVVFQASISTPSGFGFHRVQRMPIYPNGNPY